MLRFQYEDHITHIGRFVVQILQFHSWLSLTGLVCLNLISSTLSFASMSTKAAEWPCSACTFLNQPSLQQCEMCEAKKPPVSAAPAIQPPIELQPPIEIQTDSANHESVKQFLSSINPTVCQLYFAAFIEEAYDRIENIKTIEMKDLEEMNVKRGWRKRIMNAIKNLQSNTNTIGTHTKQYRFQPTETITSTQNIPSSTSQCNKINPRKRKLNEDHNVTISHVFDPNPTSKKRKLMVMDMPDIAIPKDEPSNSNSNSCSRNDVTDSDSDHTTQDHKDSYTQHQQMSQSQVPPINEQKIMELMDVDQDKDDVQYSKCQEKEQVHYQIEYEANDVIQRIGQQWGTHEFTHRDPVEAGYIKVIEGMSYIIIDLKDVSLKLKSYKLHQFECNIPVKWRIEATNDENYLESTNWTAIHNHERVIQGDKYDVNQTVFNVDNDNIEFYSKFKFMSTASGLNEGLNIIKLDNLKLYGDINRTVYKALPKAAISCKFVKLPQDPWNNKHFEGECVIKEESKSDHDQDEQDSNCENRYYELKNFTKLSTYPRVDNKLSIGDTQNALEMINSSGELHHDECDEYKEEIPGLAMELYDFQKRAVSWMINIEAKGNKYGSYGGLLCDEMGLGKTVTTVALMLSA